MFVRVVAVVCHEAKTIAAGMVIEPEDVAEFVRQYVTVSFQATGVVADNDVR